VTDEVRNIEKGQDMTRKDYELIAEAIRKSLLVFEDREIKKQRDDSAIATAVIIRHLQEEFKRDNPRFNAEKFWEACAI
tara:strand:- start:419 stop:655 length:237 start_codon:yes stop_codon:yes gene_type:complete